MRFISFKKKYAELIILRRKTATVRLTDVFEAGKVYPLRADWFKPPLCHIKIPSKKRKRLKAISHEETLKGGFSNLVEF